MTDLTALNLEKVELLSGLDVQTQQQIVASLKKHHFNAGDVVFHKGSTGQSLYFVEQGIMNVVHVAGGPQCAPPDHSDSQVVDQIKAGSVFGEMALLLAMPRTATICAKTNAIVFELQRVDFEAAAANSSILKERLQEVKEQRFLRFRRDLEEAVLYPKNLDSKQRAYLKEVFAQIDMDGSGDIDKGELSIMLTRLTGRFYAKDQVDAMMKMLDEDGSGRIDEEEFLAGLPLLAKWLITAKPGTRTHDSCSTELHLDKVELLKGIDSETSLKIIKALKPRQFQAGDIVFKKGSTGRSLFFLQQGVMDVVVGEGDADPTRPELDCYCVDQIYPGSVFGEMALLLSVPRTATIFCASASAVAFELERSDFEAAAKSSSFLAKRLDDVKEERFDRFRADLETAVLSPENMDDKQRAYLLEVFHQIDADGSGAIDEQEFAAMLCRLSGQTFSDSQVASMMKTLDKDGNSTIEADEFLAGLPLLAKWLVKTNGKPKKRIQKIWAKFSNSIHRVSATSA